MNKTPAEVLKEEADWLLKAYKNAIKNDEPLSAEYLRGFKAAEGWVRFHSEHPHLLENRNE